MNTITLKATYKQNKGVLNKRIVYQAVIVIMKGQRELYRIVKDGYHWTKGDAKLHAQYTIKNWN